MTRVSPGQARERLTNDRSRSTVRHRRNAGRLQLLHVHAWQRAFSERGFAVESWRIHRRIGMDGSTLVDELVPGISDDAAARAEDLNSRYYQELTGLLRPLPGALRLLDDVAALGLQVVLATSAPEDELAVLRKVLGSDDIVSAVTSSEDVDTVKPKPGIVEVALGRACRASGSRPGGPTADCSRPRGPRRYSTARGNSATV